MSHKSSIKFFQDDSLTKIKAKELAKDYEKALEWENQIVSNEGVAPLNNQETIVRQLFVPIHYNVKTKKIDPTAFDDVFNKGLSINRLSLSKLEKILYAGEEKAKRDREFKPDREFIGYAQTSVQEIKKLIEDSYRIFGLYATALKEDHSHADICEILQNEKIAKGLTVRTAKSQRRKKLSDLFNKKLTILENKITKLDTKLKEDKE